MFKTRLLSAFLLLSLAGCGYMDIELPLPAIKELPIIKAKKKPAWQSPLLQQHHLVGRIWRPAEGRFVEEDELVEELVRSAFVLLGEKHDNADHHLLQARLLTAMIDLGRRPAVVWEMIPEARQPVLNRYYQEYSRNAAALGTALGWDASGWPDWALYQPIAQAALDAHLPMYGAGLSKGAIRALARGEPSFEFARSRRALGLNIPLPTALRQRSLAQLFQGHCELMPRDAMTPLLNVQQARDAVFAEHLLGSAVDDGAVLIAGDGHVRNDFGVPLYLARHQPNVRITSVAIVEVRDEVLDPNDYAASFSAPVMPYDYVWFTPRANDKDHCAELRRKWGKPAKPKVMRKPEPAAPAAPPPAKVPEKPKPKPEAKDAPEAAATAETPKAEMTAKDEAAIAKDAEIKAKQEDAMIKEPEMSKEKTEPPAPDPQTGPSNQPPIPRAKPPRPASGS